MHNESIIQVVDPYAQDLAKAASALAATAGGSEDAYFEAGYFLIYATMRGWRLGLGLEPGQTTEKVLWTEFQLVATLVGQRIGQPFSRWEKLGAEEESGLIELSTSHGVLVQKRSAWYEQFPPGDQGEWVAGTVVWEFAEQLARSAHRTLLDEERDRIMAAVAVALGMLHGEALAQRVEAL